MAFVITQNCCTDASCVPVCPVDCIRPVPGEDTVAPPMLYIDPTTCVDCGACVAVCPVDAIRHEDELGSQARFAGINAAYFAGRPLTIRPMPAGRPSATHGTPRVAVVGAGPAACYAVSDLVHSGAEVNLFERLPTPFGLIRAGVAPDHQRTKEIASTFAAELGRSDVRCFFNVDVGTDIGHDELMTHHDAVIYAVGASQSRMLGIPGEELPGSHAAADVVAWYNGHPDRADLRLDVSGSRVVIVGNGNVALDVARVFVMDRQDLAATDIADSALTALRDSSIEEVIVLGRRGAGDAAFSTGELLALGALPGVDVVIRGEVGQRPDDFERAMTFDIVAEMAGRTPTPGHRRIVLWFGARPVEICGRDAVESVVIESGGESTSIETPIVLRSIGYRGVPVPGLPFDDASGTIPNDSGRVLEDGKPLPGVYVTGWIKRGPRGVIGTNRTCARETVNALLDDVQAGLPVTGRDSSELVALLESRHVETVDWSGWLSIDTEERARGAELSRPRLKLTDRAALVDAASR
ncbi:FAD-dependent oxidoreductase [Mycolicibacterium obuense]|uniref:ferredoxin--NADP(+) reductase n=1 Tax=Mycolicibacterium obuense TaxID=1807 RepID=A0A0J6W3G8_9MYCO|nr:FAD-dependent oxidoreductase [Mycolicibacterium obuense]KKF03541.1 ferredoxin [Mycolicibacterium obuense]KMO76298.1 NADPH-ferredoxin reductase FprA [Mycolicibacterium obuense]